MREQGVVVKVEDGIVTVAMAVAKHDDCSSCGVCRAASNGRQMLADIRCDKPHEVGETVTVDIPGPGQATSALFLLLIPLILFLVGIGLGWVLFREKDALALLLGLCGMGVGWAIAALVDRHIRRSPKHQPRIVEE